MARRASYALPLAALVVAMALLFVLPWFAATVVRGALVRESAADRAAFASGHSPWAWRFHHPEDVVAGRAFGAGALSVGTDALIVRATDASGFEVGVPLRRVADLTRLHTLMVDGVASAPGRYAVAVRETLTGPGFHASIGVLAPDHLGDAVRLDQLAWADDHGKPVVAPARAAMLRLHVALPPGQTLTLASLRLVPAPGFQLPAPRTLPEHLTAEALLNWRDTERARDPLVGFAERGAAPVSDTTGPSAWQPWMAPGLYLLVILLARLARRAYLGARDTGWVAVADAILVLAGPVGFIAGLGLSLRPASAGVAAFAIGVLYGLFLSARRQLPAWYWLRTWGRQVLWPLAAIPVALAVAALVGHAPAWPSAGSVLLYIGWALFQQWLMLAVFAALLDRALPRALAVLLTATAFALLHTPNGMLMQLCFVAELGWSWWYLRHRSLVPVAVAHAASAVIMQAFVAGGALRSLEVSARFLS